jgi:hypothetical protein
MATTCGVLLAGAGQIWMAYVQIDVVETNVPTTGRAAPLRDHPVNLDFGQRSAGWCFWNRVNPMFARR